MVSPSGYTFIDKLSCFGVGPAGEGAASELGIAESISVNVLPKAIYKPELCIRTTVEAARVHGFPVERIIFEVTEGERIEDGPWFADMLRDYKRCGFKTAIDDFGAGYAGLKRAQHGGLVRGHGYPAHRRDSQCALGHAHGLAEVDKAIEMDSHSRRL